MSVSVLLLRFAGPLQSWGDRPSIDDRMTGSVPTKSGVIGLLAAALGMERGESLKDLRALRIGVRVEQRGRLLVDYHTVSNYEWIGPDTLQPKNLPNSQVNASGMQRLRTGKTPMTTIPTRRYYLQDAVFLVGLEGHEETLRRLDKAVRNPMYPLALGRRSCPPAGQVSLGMRRGESLWKVLKEEEWRPGPLARRAKERDESAARKGVELEFHVEDSDGEPVRDVPVNFAPSERAWTTRKVLQAFHEVNTGLEADDEVEDSEPVKAAAGDSSPVQASTEAADPEHDPLGWWTEEDDALYLANPAGRGQTRDSGTAAQPAADEEHGH